MANTPTPLWLADALRSMQTAFPSDRFEAIFFDARGWRMKCYDCPGKLYTPGQGETLSNFHIHLRNRRHRNLVADRVASAHAQAVLQRQADIQRTRWARWPLANAVKPKL